jgi:hypothetical protein
MTGIIYNSTFVDAAGRKFHGAIAWGLSTPKQLEATLRPHRTTSELADPIWTHTG